METAAPEFEVPFSIEQEELRGISRTIAGIHGLLLALILLYLVVAGVRENAQAYAAVMGGVAAYAVAAIVLRYLGIWRRESRWKIGAEVVAMVAVITWALTYTGGLASPLISAYLLPVIAAALTLGRAITLAVVAFIALSEVILVDASFMELFVSPAFIGELVAEIVPVLVVAYVTSMFSADIRFGLGEKRLLSETDLLTGMFKPRGFSLVAGRTFARVTRHGRPASVLMIDCDSPEPVTVKYGEEVANELVRRLSESILGELRYTDVAARCGEDEFVVLLAETPRKGARGVAERIRVSAAAGLENIGGISTKSTVSIGLASYPEDGRSLDEIVVSADRALDRAKEQGSNRVVPSEATAGAAA